MPAVLQLGDKLREVGSGVTDVGCHMFLKIPESFHMHILIKCLLLLTLLCSVRSGIAHDANIATFQIRQLPEGQWLYEVMTPLHNLDESMRNELGQDAPSDDLNSVEYKQAIVAHIKNGFDVTVNNDITGVASHALKLGKGRIKLNQHLSVLIFEIQGMPKEVKKLDFKLANRSDNSHQTNIFRLIKGKQTKRYILNQHNDFSGSDLGFFNNPLSTKEGTT